MRVKRFVLSALLLCLALGASAQQTDKKADSDGLSIEQRRANRGLVDRNNVFVPKGQWIFGGRSREEATAGI